ncbi:MAG: hypothetical protein AB1Z65_15640 [Candidatus Sulfomarinibacteraceae bacterium]
MRVRTTVLLGFALLACGLGWSQNRLSDVAGGIKLNPEAIVEKKGFVEDPGAAKKADRELFNAAVGECATIADNLGSLVDEAKSSFLYSDDELPKRLSAATLDLDTELQEIYLLRLTDVYAQPLSTARQAVETCSVATASIRAELARQGVQFLEATQDLSRCRKELDRSLSELAAVDQVAAGSAPAPTEDEAETPPTDDELIASICATAAKSGPDAMDACTGRQYRALAALTSRTPENEQLDPGVFGDIRALCVELHPDDFYLRNTCEVDKMTATRIDAEAAVNSP